MPISSPSRSVVARLSKRPLAKRMARHAEDAAQLLRALSHPARLLVLCSLVEGEKAAGELETLAGLSQSALSQHLAVLREQGLVRTRREAQSVIYTVADGPALAVLRALHQEYCSES